MKYGWSLNLHDRDGDVYDECLLVHVGEDTILKFTSVEELDAFADKIKGSIREIKENL